MGFLDKAKQAIDKGQDKLEDLQAKRASDQLLRDLGAWYYATRTGRDGGDGNGHVERLVGELQAFEAANGPLGGAPTTGPETTTGGASDAVVPEGGPPPPAAAAPPPPPFSTAPPPPPAAPMPPAEPSAPVTPGPPPPPPASGPPPAPGA